MILLRRSTRTVYNVPFWGPLATTRSSVRFQPYKRHPGVNYLELVHRHGHPGRAKVAGVIASARNREKIKRAAELLDLPLTGSFDQALVRPGPYPKRPRKNTKAAARAARKLARAARRHRNTEGQ